MSRPKKTPVTRHNICLFEGDLDKLKDLYPEHGASLIIRTLVRKHIKKVEDRVDERVPDVDVEV